MHCLKKKIKILHCPDNVAGNPQMLASAERKLGQESYLVCFYESRYKYHSDEILFGSNKIKNEFMRWGLFFRALFFYDVIHYNYGSTIFPQVMVSSYRYSNNFIINLMFSLYVKLFEFFDVKVFKFFQKKIYVTFQGDDARQGDFCNIFFNNDYVNEAGYYSTESDYLKRQRISKFDKYANSIFALNPDLMHVLPSRTRFMPYAHIDIEKWTKISKSSNGVLHIVHAPSHRGVKGTRFINEAIDRLITEGYSFTYTQVENTPHVEARKIYETADVLIDQLLIGWYGGLAVELMALGKIVLCYLREEDLCYIPRDMRADLPIINVNVSSLYDRLKIVLEMSHEDLREVGDYSRQYVEKWHNPKKIAEQLIEIYSK